MEYTDAYPRTTIIHSKEDSLCIDFGAAVPGHFTDSSTSIEKILLTCLDRDYCAGIPVFPKLTDAGRRTVEIVTPEGDAPGTPKWGLGVGRWHTYDFRPSEKPLVPPISPPTPDRSVADGDTIEWRGVRFEVLYTPFLYDSGISYLFEMDGTRYCACGSLVGGDGTVRELYSLQRGYDTRDYHGFMGNVRLFGPSAARIITAGVDVLIPAWGPIVEGREAVRELLSGIAERLAEVYANYISISALNHYFPERLAMRRREAASAFRLFDETIASLPGKNSEEIASTVGSDKVRATAAPLEGIEYLSPGQTSEMPPWIRRIAPTSYAVFSEDGAGFLIDCARPDVASRWQKLVIELSGSEDPPEFVWITHYHDDHVDGLEAFLKEFPAPVESSPSVADVLETPGDYMLPCQCPIPYPTVRRKHGERRDWHEFSLTAFELPGQSLYHSGLLVEGRGTRALFAGDSFSPTGLDDYCAYNRNLIGKGFGFDRCLALLGHLEDNTEMGKQKERQSEAKNAGKDRSDLLIINQHQSVPFAFGTERVSQLVSVLDDRRKLLDRLLPWPAPDFGLDPSWIRTQPYDQTVAPGASFEVELVVTNHAYEPLKVRAEPFLPVDGSIEWINDADITSIPAVAVVPAGTSLSTPRPVGQPVHTESISFKFTHAELPGQKRDDEIIIPFRVWLNGVDIGLPCHALIVTPPRPSPEP